MPPEKTRAGNPRETRQRLAVALLLLLALLSAIGTLAVLRYFTLVLVAIARSLGL